MYINVCMRTGEGKRGRVTGMCTRIRGGGVESDDTPSATLECQQRRAIVV